MQIDLISCSIHCTYVDRMSISAKATNYFHELENNNFISSATSDDEKKLQKFHQDNTFYYRKFIQFHMKYKSNAPHMTKKIDKKILRNQFRLA